MEKLSWDYSKQSTDFALLHSVRVPYCKQWVLEAGKVVILVTEATSKFHLEENDVENVSYNDPLFNVWSNPENNRFYDENTVFNVALKVTDIQQVVNNVIEGGGVVVTPPTSIKDEHGEIDIAVVKSCIGNVYHTLLSYHKYSGHFLPGFTTAENTVIERERNYGLVTHIDHIAFVCDQGSTPHILKWYEKCFCMRRFFINRYALIAYVGSLKITDSKNLFTIE